MRSITKALGMVGLALMLSVSVNTSIKAQSPADDPGIGGPGSPGNGPSGDGAPVVPFDGGMSLMLLAGGIAFASNKIKDLKLKVS